MNLPGSAGEHRLQKMLGSDRRAKAFYDKQMLPHLNAEMRAFIQRQEMMFVATADAQGNCDCTLRAGIPGFVRVLDRQTLTWPEYRGNGVMASLGNLSENPHVGVIFVDFFGSTVGLHVNGQATIVENSEQESADGVSPSSSSSDQKRGRQPERWVRVVVEEAYIHCSKHVPLLKKLDKKIHWGTDDPRHKGGDFFRVRQPD